MKGHRRKKERFILDPVYWIRVSMYKYNKIYVCNHAMFSYHVFLALLDYVSRAHEIEIRPSSVVRPSVRRPSSVCGIDYLWSYCMDCLQISVVASPGPYAQTFFFHFWRIFFFNFLGFFFDFVNMGPYGSQNFKTLLLFKIFQNDSKGFKISFESFQTFSEISSQWSSQKYCFGFLKF